MGETKPFQIVFISVCVVLTIAGVFVFSFGGTKEKQGAYVGPEVIVWGTEDSKKIDSIIQKLNTSTVSTVPISYVQKDSLGFNQILLEALASGKGPDVILASMEDILTYQNKLLTISFETLSERTFKDNFIEQGEAFRTGTGYLAIPFSVDPLVLYWNRDIFTIHNKTSPPSNWSTVVSLVPEMRDISEDLTVFESVISLGDYRNIDNAKGILTALMLQSGTPITTLNYNNTANKVELTSLLSDSNRDTLITPAVAALNFYTQFADPLSKVYSWNRSLPRSLEMFASDDLAMYIGFGSEAGLIRSKNPNLNFDMALLPQSSASSVPVTYGKMVGLSILASSKNQAGAYAAILSLTSSAFLDAYNKESGLPPVRRDLLATVPGTANDGVLYRSALYSRGFLDPNPEKTNSIFQTMVESVLSGRLSSGEAVQTADSQLNLLVEEFNQKQNE
jgi:ABC-type glycerol-3-phosphate transport system substrate-binding protein